MIQVPKVSVLVQTFNHQPFVTEAIDSVLNQRTSFPIEIIVGDDCSTDGTRELLTRLRADRSDRFSLFFPQVNLGAGGAELAQRLLRQARGEYGAWLDGDDYWLGDSKLEAQVEFLDAHRDSSMCWHRAQNLNPDCTLTPYEDNFDYDTSKSFYSLEDVIFQNFIPTASVLFRNGLVDLPSSYTRVPSPDWFFNALLAERGSLGLIDQVWSVRRMHPGGVISMKSQEEKFQFNIDCVRMIDAHFNGVYRPKAKARLAYLYREFALYLRHKGRPWSAALKAAMSLAESPRDDRWPRVETLSMIAGPRFAAAIDRLLG